MVTSAIGEVPSMNEKMKIILDTDIGDDIDDAFALSILLQDKRVDLLGVTTVFRNSKMRAQMASSLALAFHHPVPVYKGVDDPFIQTEKDLISEDIRKKEKKDEEGKYYIPQFMEEMKKSPIEKEHAVDFIIRMVHLYPHEIILVGIGPLTNIAMALRKDPTIIPLLKEIRIMGGEPTNDEVKEWNIFCDPEAAHIVFASNVPLYMIGLNVTMKCQLIKKYRDILESIHEKQYELLVTMMQKWFQHYEFTMPVMHDPLAVATLLGNFCTFKKERFSVDLKDKRAGIVKDSLAREVYYADTVDVEKFFTYFIQTIFNR